MQEMLYILLLLQQGSLQKEIVILSKCCKLFYSFLKKWPAVKETVAPDLIIWENLSVGRFSRFIRILFVSIFTMIVICGTFYLTILEKDKEKEMKQYSPVIDCPSF